LVVDASSGIIIIMFFGGAFIITLGSLGILGDYFFVSPPKAYYALLFPKFGEGVGPKLT